MELYLDAGVIIILILTCIVGYVRGFRKCILSIVAVFIATLAAKYSSAGLAAPVYDRYLRDKVKSHVVSAIEDYDPKSVIMEKLNEQGYGEYVSESEIDEMLGRGGDYMENVSELLRQKGADKEDVESLRKNIDGYFSSELPGTITQQLEQTGLTPYLDKVDISADELRECIARAASQSKEDAADYIVEKAIKPVLVGVIRMLLFWLIFLIVSLLLKLIIAISGLAGDGSELKAADRFAGLALGVVKGLIYCAAVGWVLSSFCSATKNSISVMNVGVSEKTYLFRYFFDFFYK